MISNQLIPNAPMGLIGEDDPKKKKDPFDDEIRILTKKNLPFDNKPTLEVIRNVSKQSGVNSALLLSSAFQEGMNKAIAKPDDISQAYFNNIKGDDEKNFPVDGFYNYGIDKFSEYLPRIKGDLPAGFESRYKIYPAKNELGQSVNTAAFRTNEDALIVKSAILKDAMREVDKYAKSKGVELDENAKNYFTLARYNASPKSFQLMLDEYAKAKDKKAFIDKGETSKKKIHENISPRLKRMVLAQSILDENPLGNK